MKKIIAKLRKRIAKLRHEQDGCRGYGMCSSDTERMRDLRFEIKGLQTAIRLLQRSR